MTGLYNADGQQQVTIVSGSSYTGLYSPDGQFNGVTNDGVTTYKGVYHPCGAFNVCVVTDPSVGAYAKNGSLNIIASSNGFALVGVSRIPSWVTPGASIDMDFANNRYYGGSISSLMSVSRASNETDLLPTSPSGYVYNTFGSNVLAISPTFGLQIFQPATNLYINSTTPVTRTITLPAIGDFTLWVNGSGSAAIAAGTATITGAGTATNNVPVTINCSVTGTVVVTVTGSLNTIQLEAGTFGTPFIVTAGAPVTRAADDVTFTGAAQTLVTGAALSAVIGITQVPVGWPGPIFNKSGGGFAGNANNGQFGSYALSSSNGITQLSQVVPAGWWSSPRTAGFAFNASGRTLTANAASTSDGVTVLPLNNHFGLNDGTYANSVFGRLALFNSRIS